MYLKENEMDDIKILVVDDDKEIVELIKIHLSSEGYRIIKAYNGYDALKAIDNNKIHLAILDIMMPGIDGLELCRQIRKKMNIPILMLSARSEDIDKIIGLSTGADDYISKPFNPLELVARVKSQLRRYIYLNPQNTDNMSKNIINIDELVINYENHTVSIYGEEKNLTPTEFEILFLLASNRGRVFNTEELFKQIWKERYFAGSNNTVMVHIRKIREKIEQNPRQPKFIKTVWGVGYKIEK